MPRKAREATKFYVIPFGESSPLSEEWRLDHYLKTHKALPWGCDLVQNQRGAITKVRRVMNSVRVAAAIEGKLPFLLIPPNLYLFGAHVWALTESELDLELDDDELARLFQNVITERERGKEALLCATHLREATRRDAIPERVRMLVWRRDQAMCVVCGSREKLEFDHIIPVSKGGSNTERNLQLLCETCNRKKSAKI